MKIRTLDELLDFSDKELAWRKKEITLAFSNYVDSKNEIQKNYYMRVFIMLLYSHWEGYIKSVSSAYINYIVNKKLRFSALKQNFIAAGLSSKVDNNFSIKNIRHKNEMVKLLLQNLSQEKFTGDSDVIIDTESNLNIDVLEKICITVGVDINLLDIQKIWLDERLLKYRNKIAHGERMNSQEITFDLRELKDLFIRLLMQYQTLISNAASTKSYLSNGKITDETTN